MFGLNLNAMTGLSWVIVVVLLEAVADKRRDLVVRVGVVVELGDAVERCSQPLNLRVAGKVVGKLDRGEVVVELRMHRIADDVAVLAVGAAIVPPMIRAERSFNDAAAQVLPLLVTSLMKPPVALPYEASAPPVYRLALFSPTVTMLVANELVIGSVTWMPSTSKPTWLKSEPRICI